VSEPSTELEQLHKRVCGCWAVVRGVDCPILIYMRQAAAIGADFREREIMNGGAPELAAILQRAGDVARKEERQACAALADDRVREHTYMATLNPRDAFEAMRIAAACGADARHLSQGRPGRPAVPQSQGEAPQGVAAGEGHEQGVQGGRRSLHHATRPPPHVQQPRTKVAAAQVVKSITGHATDAMMEHYSLIDVGEKQEVVRLVMALVSGSATTSIVESSPDGVEIESEGSDE
jgi:hypothetical protein